MPIKLNPLFELYIELQQRQQLFFQNDSTKFSINLSKHNSIRFYRENYVHAIPDVQAFEPVG